ncbi:mannosyltransferase putative-domain-containing protein [Leucosporidium creatinivorum]|uniref:Mannosyltransferase putative-domain-containing protein n=1 Tax=Leucosporidium creatinivorum TaxID=106004 RepID=A0A1Y2FBF3_9BASI|nr:mannosyltransferase putative-domain-containing protein [Leucosporidium creatinivorum]
MTKAPLLPFKIPSPTSSSPSPYGHRSSPSSASNFTPRRLYLPLSLLTICLLTVASWHFSGSAPSTTNVLGYWSGSKLVAEGAVSSTVSSSSSGRTGTKGAGRDPWQQATEALDVRASLEERLAAWESSPRNEPADWVAKNLETCPDYRIKPNQNMQMLENSHLKWATMNSSRINGLRGEMIAYLRKAEKEGKMGQKAWGKGRGLVFTAGNSDTFSRVLLTLKLLHKHLDSKLPSEIFSFPGEEPTDEVRKELESFGARLKVVKEAVRDGSRTKNYHIKATAIIRSSFREVLYLDSDNMPSGSLHSMDGVFSPSSSSVIPGHETNATREEKWTDPSGLWESKSYKRLGIMQWPDYWRTSADNPIWSMIGVPCRDEWEQEAGQLLVDKKLHLDALLLAEWMMDSQRFAFWFNFSDGDKDMFRFSLLALRKRWAVPGRYVGVGALPRNTMSGFCGHTMLQHDHLGRPLFVHANLLKQIPSGVGKGFAWGKTRSVHLSPPGLTLPPGNPLDHAEILEDYDTDCDQLANAGNDGRAISEAPPAIRRRAVLEKGLRPFFHGGWVSALCIDVKWVDPRTEEELTWARIAAAGADFEGDLNEVDVSYTVSGDGVEIKFENPLEVLEWKDDPRLRYFEDAFFEEGGRVNGQGF